MRVACMNSYYVLEYLYRDANNFKAFGQILLSGNISENYITEIKSYLDSGEFFVAEQVNIPTLYSQLWKYSNGPTIADHTFHEFSSLHSPPNMKSHHWIVGKKHLFC
jgi:hypothetical protein